MGGSGGGGGIPSSLYDCIAPTWQGVYLEGVHRLLSPPPAAQPQYVGPELGRWVHNWVTRKMLLYMQHKRRHEPRQPPEVWQTFGQLFLPKCDRDFVRRALWRKLGTRMERLGGKLCPLDGRAEDHEHVLRHCMFHGGGDSAGPRTPTTLAPPPPPPLGAFGQQLVAKGVALRRPWAPKAPDAP